MFNLPADSKVESIFLSTRRVEDIESSKTELKINFPAGKTYPLNPSVNCGLEETNTPVREFLHISLPPRIWDSLPIYFITVKHFSWLKPFVP